MNPNEDKIAQFLEDTVMYSAVKAVLFAQCDLNKANTKVSFAETSNEQLGQLIRGWEQAREILTFGFKELEKYRKDTTEKSTGVNPAY